jgi:Protein of unknown function (DUF2652)
MSVGTVNALLVIADIGGYTRFMSLHRTSLAHAQENTLRLLDAIIDAAPDLELSGLEGDAAFLYATDPSAEEITRSLAGLATAMHRAFHDEQAHMESLRVCWCDGCVQTGRLTVKVVAHYGEVVLSATRGHATLAGIDVIFVHRMLKNSVPIHEYVLMSEAVRERCEPQIAELATPIDEELEGLGAERLCYVDMAELAEPAGEPEPVSRLERAVFHAGLTSRTLPYLVGLKRSQVEVEP